MLLPLHSAPGCAQRLNLRPCRMRRALQSAKERNVMQGCDGAGCEGAGYEGAGCDAAAGSCRRTCLRVGSWKTRDGRGAHKACCHGTQGRGGRKRPHDNIHMIVHTHRSAHVTCFRAMALNRSPPSMNSVMSNILSSSTHAPCRQNKHRYTTDVHQICQTYKYTTNNAESIKNCRIEHTKPCSHIRSSTPPHAARRVPLRRRRRPP